MKIGIIREGKVPPDSRVPLTPQQCAYIMDKYPVEITVQSSEGRCYTDEEYREQGINITDQVDDCEVLMGVKEVPVEQLVSDKIYFFFSHTIKKQAYNRDLLRSILEKNIQMLDYEVLTNKKGARIIAFGRFAGIVGAHNGVHVYGERTGLFHLKRMVDCKDYAEAKTHYKALDLPNFRTVVTGTGRVAKGAVEVLDAMGIKRVTPHNYLSKTYDEPVFTQLDGPDYLSHKERGDYKKKDFYKNPQNYEINFTPYTKSSDLLINGIFWDNRAPAFFTKEEMQADDFRVKVIADVTCDIAPVASIPSTLYATTIADPIFGYDVRNHKACEPYQEYSVDMMTIDNLPNEMPRDASKAFGEQFINHVLEELIDKEESDMITRASVTVNGALGPHFGYLEDYVAGKE